MTYKDLQYDVTDGIATITLDRPERLNAISGGMLASFSAAFREADTTETCASSSSRARARASAPDST